jgi:uncharacterized protein YgbK (DUF1537 family)
MIVVIADDLSGAAELAGAALNHGLAAEVQTTFTPETDTEVICLDTDTRSRNCDEAAARVTEFAREIAAGNPEWIYKKCDSVLRGNVLAEIRAIVEVTNRQDALLISANPSRGRIIRGGEYFIDGQPLHQTSFANDPEHPRRTSRVTELLGATNARVCTPDAETVRDLDRQARAIPSQTLPAGGVEFFEALLRARRKIVKSFPRPASSTKQSAPVLFVCGSAAAWTKGRGAQAESRGVQIERVPREMLAMDVAPEAIDRWSHRLATSLRSSLHVMAAIGRTKRVPNVTPSQLAERLSRAVVSALHWTNVGTLCAEGGATAAAVARAMSWGRFQVTRQIAGGVVEMQPMVPGAPAFIIKVGSYDWPEEIWPNEL